MTTHTILSERLADFLAQYGEPVEVLLADIDPSFGPPLLVVATGSVLHGFGNERSDLDVNVVVEHNELSNLSLPSFERGFLLDTLYFAASDVAAWTRHSREHGWPPEGRLQRSTWRQRLKELVSSVRFAHGLSLQAEDGWSEWLEDLRRPWLQKRVVQWWCAEALRRRVAARWLTEDNPQLASQQWCDAALAALEARAAGAGELFFGTKWLPEKFRKLGDEASLAQLREALRIPVDPGAAVAHAERCDALVDVCAGALPPLAAQLWYAPGVTLRTGRTRTLVSHHDMRTVETRDSLPDIGGEPVWEGTVETRPPETILRLFAENMTWISLVAVAA
jgi:hypothetical protein